jgi:hypothetical protein
MTAMSTPITKAGTTRTNHEAKERQKSAGELHGRGQGKVSQKVDGANENEGKAATQAAVAMYFQIDLDKVEEVCNSGIRRTTVFLGFGINTSLDKKVSNFDISRVTSLQFTIPEVDSHT